jgi:hypothetical protein
VVDLSEADLLPMPTVVYGFSLADKIWCTSVSRLPSLLARISATATFHSSPSLPSSTFHPLFTFCLVRDSNLLPSSRIRRDQSPPRPVG